MPNLLDVWAAKPRPAYTHKLRGEDRINDNITADRLRAAVIYDADTGLFTWRVNHSMKARSGRPAGTKPRKGYQDLRIDGQLYRAHRLAWLYVHGYMPQCQIDHINGDRLDNRMCNLRLANQTQQCQNRASDARNKSGYRGVSWSKQKNAWRATIVVDYKQRDLGAFVDPAEAHAAYLRAARELFGEYRRTT